MKEYCIYVRQGNASPYIVSSYKNLVIRPTWSIEKCKILKYILYNL